MKFKHTSVLLNECIEGLNIKRDGIYVDGTTGGGGHSLHIAELLSSNGKLIGIDRDKNAVFAACKTLSDYMDICTIVRGNFSDFTDIMDSLEIKMTDGVLLDLGVSSYQLDTPERGFSYMHDAPLDMRMDERAELSAYEVINTYSENNINKILFEYGEERWAKRIAKFIIARRAEKPIQTTFELVSVIQAAIPKKAREEGQHPAKRTFQAIRIEVNSELSILEQTLRDIVKRLNKGGRVCVITFHSLEDRIVKNTFREMSNPCNCPRDFPICICGKKPLIRILTGKPIKPTQEEINLNHRSRSAKLRVIERI